MRKHSKILVLGVTCLILLFVMSSLFGCKTIPVKKSEPEFKTVMLRIYEEEYPIKIPGFMPDFTEFIENSVKRLRLIDLINWYVPDGNIDSEGLKDHYRLIFDADIEVIPGTLALITFMGPETKIWLYDANGLPYMVSLNEGFSWLQAWENEKQKEMFTDFKEERNKDKAISMEIRAELKKQSEATVRETNKDLGI